MLTLTHLTHRYPIPGQPTDSQRTVLNIPHWQRHPGQQVLLRGISGSGKTTLFNIIAGLLTPTQGTVHLADTDLFALPEARRDRFRAAHVGYIFQNHHLLPGLTALENVLLPMHFASTIPAHQRATRAHDLLARVNLTDHATYRPAQLSTGQRLRVAIARALANQPTLLLADEPTAALDSAGSEGVIDLLLTTAQEHNTILLVASHDPALDARFTDIIQLQHGHLAERPQPQPIPA